MRRSAAAAPERYAAGEEDESDDLDGLFDDDDVPFDDDDVPF